MCLLCVLSIERGICYFYVENLTTEICAPKSYLLTSWCRVLLEKLAGLQLVKKFPAFHGTRWFITAHTSVRHASLSWASPIQSIYPHPTSWRSILMLSTSLRLGLPSGLHPSGPPGNIPGTAGRNMSAKNCSNPIGNRTRDPPSCSSTVPQLRAPCTVLILIYFCAAWPKFIVLSSLYCIDG